MDLLTSFGEAQGKYIFPREMPECIVAMEEIMKKRPIISYRIFVNNIDKFIPQELAKVFVTEKFLERKVEPQQASSSSSSEEEMKSRRGKSIRRQSSRTKSKGKSTSSVGSSSDRRQSSKKYRRQSSKQDRRQSAKQDRRQSAKQDRRKSSKRRQSAKQDRRKSSKKDRRQSTKNTRRESKRKTMRISKDKKKRRSPMGTRQPVMSKKKIAKYFQQLWPVHVLHRPKCSKRYDWLGDYSHLEEKRLTALQIQGFDPEKAKAKRNCNYAFSEDMKVCLRKKFWYYTRFMPEPPPVIQPVVEEEEKPAPRKTPVETIVNNRIGEFLKEPIKQKPIDFYKRDIEIVEPKYEVYATTSSKNIKLIDKLDPEIKKIVKYISMNPTNRDEFIINIFTCTTFVFDISSEDSDIDEAKAVLDMLIAELSAMDPVYRVKVQSYFGIHTYFLISPLLTWGESKELERLAIDNVIREEFFPKRIPHPRYKKHYDFENYVHDKCYQFRDMMRIIIIGVGLVYGQGGHLDKYIDLARENKSFLPVFGPGKNLINVIHSTELARLIIHLLQNFPYFTPYIVAAEKRPVTQKQILEAMSSCVAENYIKMVPFCFNKTFGIPLSSLDVMTSECNIFPSYLNDAAGWIHNKGFVHDACSSMLDYIENGSSKPLRLVFFGPFSIDQTKIAMEVAKHYNTMYINPSKAVYILLKLVMRMQDILLAMTDPRPSINDKYRMAMGKKKLKRFNVLRLLAWQREFRRFLLRNKSLLPIRRNSDRSFNIRLHEYLSETKSASELDKATGPESLLSAAKNVLMRYEKLIKGSPGTLIPARFEVVAEIIHEILQHPILKFTGYVLDGAPATEIEAEIIFTRTQGLGGTEDKPPEPTKDSKKQTDKDKQAEKEKHSELESKFSGHYERLPIFVFHTAKKTSTCLRDCVTKQAKSFQKEYMDKFQHLEFYKHNVGKIKSTLDFFSTHTSILPITFDTSRETISEILNHIYVLIGSTDNYAGKMDPRGTLLKPATQTSKLHLPNIGSTLTLGMKNSIASKELEDVDEEYSKEVFKEMKDLADRCLPYGYFLNRFLFNSLTEALTETAVKNPEDPVDFFAEHLFRNNTSGRMPRDKILPPPQRVNMETYPFNVPKYDLRFSSHL